MKDIKVIAEQKAFNAAKNKNYEAYNQVYYSGFEDGYLSACIENENIISDSLREKIKTMLEIVSAAFHDNYAAGNIPGSGYSNRAQSMVSSKFGWRDKKQFEIFESEIKRITEGVGNDKEN